MLNLLKALKVSVFKGHKWGNQPKKYPKLIREFVILYQFFQFA